ncbi:MAG: pirin family protein [Clostridia bacterium]|nr:pirin family protein [Clostridia bacterium]
MSKIISEYRAKPVMEGAGVLVNRVFGHGETTQFDPFLMLDYFETKEASDSPGFPWHPHRGIETITYFLRGSGMHEDSMGNNGVISAGELQWMSAGSGIYHQEMPQTSKDGYQGFQFWLNLPQKDKMKSPEYQYINNGEMKSVSETGSVVRVISGRYDGVTGPIDKASLDVTMLHVSLDAGKSITLERGAQENGFMFVFEGSGSIDGQDVGATAGYTLDAGQIEVSASEPMEFIFAQGRPLNEPIAWGGPIVMNTREELQTAFDELEKRTFIKQR